MKLIQRVYFSLKGMKVKTMLLLLTITLLGTFLSASFSIYQANNHLEEHIKTKVSPVILIEWDNEYLASGKEQKVQTIINKYKNNERISVMENRYLLYGIGVIDIRAVDENNHIYDIFGKTRGQYLYDHTKPLEFIPYTNAIVEMFFTGIDYAKISDIHNDSATLIKGRVFTEEEIQNDDKKIFILKHYDKYQTNNFFDDKETIRLRIPQFYTVTEHVEKGNYLIENIDYDLGEFEIIGIGQENENVMGLKYHSLNSGTYHGYYISSTLMDKISNKIKEIFSKLAIKYPWYKEPYESKYEYLGSKYVSETYIELNDATELESIVKEIEKDCGTLVKGVYSFSDSYNDVKGITRNLNFIAIVSLVFSSIASIVLLSLIIQVIVNERRYEIGVYLSMGEKRINVIKQIVFEVLIIGLLGITLSLFAGNMIASSLSTDLLERQIAQIETDMDEFGTESSYEIDEKEIVNAYEVAINSEYIISVYAGGILVLLISCIVPMNGIMKMKVKKMLL